MTSPSPVPSNKPEEQESVSASRETTSEPESAATTNSDDDKDRPFTLPQHGTYYFYNSETNETTWVNPVQQPSAGASSSTSSDPNYPASPNRHPYDPNSLEARAIAAGIDPSLAHLDPSLALPAHAAPGGTFTARFNARTGAFTAGDARTPQHLSEYERMKRMSEFYFDTSAWEREVEERQREEKDGSKKRKRPSKKDLEQKKMKKIAKTAWLRT
ncbi:hypothetical protein F5141DRAFT_1193672 [Pisolithus sp. B1]|nr:hypothetical protein F5141DRAFT_1193672 [Pisolithus sp. B1]